MKAALSLSLLLMLLAPSLARAQRKQRVRVTSRARQVAIIAERAVERPIRMRRADCSGFVEAVLARAGIFRHGNTKSFYFEAIREKRLHFGAARPGDLVFFDRTYDKNDNGRVDDPLTHIAIVTGVERDGTVVMAHRGTHGIRALRMNIKKPASQEENDFLAAPGYGHRRLTGQLFRAFAHPPRR